MALHNEEEVATFLIIGFFILHGLYFAVNLPYKNFYQNYRAGLILISQGCVLLATDYYRFMKSTTDESIKARLHGPALTEIILIAISCVFSAFILSY